MQSNVTDEMIARYLSGKSSPEEEATVLDYLSESDEHLDDLLAMTASVEMFEKNAKTKKRLLWPAVSVAVSVAFLIGVGITLWHANSGTGVSIDPAPAYAAQDTLDLIENLEDTL